MAGQAPAAEPLPDAGQLRITFEGDGVAAAAADGDAVGPFDGEERGAAAAAAGPSGRFSAANMEDTTFEQLSIRLAAPYCFCHQASTARESLRAFWWSLARGRGCPRGVFR